MPVTGARRIYRILFFSCPFSLLLTSCSHQPVSDLDRLNHEQSATIRGLKDEIVRLNQELEDLLHNRQDLSKTQRELERKFKNEMASGDMSVSMQDRGLVVTVLDRVLFDSGRSDLKDSAQATLGKVADTLSAEAKNNMVYVEGHSDDRPIRFSAWRSNWELSTARATEVIHYFVESANLNPQRLAAVGYGEFHPVVANDTPEGQLKNRRVEIVISPKKLGEVALLPSPA